MIPNESFSDRSILNDTKVSVLGADSTNWLESISTAAISSEGAYDECQVLDGSRTPTRENLDSTAVFKRPLLATPIAVTCMFCSKSFGSYHVLRSHVNRKHKKLPTPSHGSTSARTSSSSARRSDKEIDPPPDKNVAPINPLKYLKDRANSVIPQLPTVETNSSAIQRICREQKKSQRIFPTDHRISPENSLQTDSGIIRSHIEGFHQRDDKQIERNGESLQPTTDPEVGSLVARFSDHGATSVAETTADQASAKKKRGRKPLPRDENGKIIRSPPILIKFQRQLAARVGRKRKFNGAGDQESRYSCDDCGDAQFKTRYFLQKHREESHTPLLSTEAEPKQQMLHCRRSQGPDKTTPIQESRYSCDECDVLFRTRYFLQKHVEASHQDLPRPEAEPKRRGRRQQRSDDQGLVLKKKHWAQSAASRCRKTSKADSSDLLQSLPIAFVVLERIPFEQCQICFHIVNKPDKLSEHIKTFHSYRVC